MTESAPEREPGRLEDEDEPRWRVYAVAGAVGALLGYWTGNPDYIFYFSLLALAVTKPVWAATRTMYQTTGPLSAVTLLAGFGWIFFGWRFSASASQYFGIWLALSAIWLVSTILASRREKS